LRWLLDFWKFYVPLPLGTEPPKGGHNPFNGDTILHYQPFVYDCVNIEPSAEAVGSLQG
jgi:hypothetical protein